MAARHRIFKRDRRTLDAIFRHPVTGNLAWSDALHLVERLGSVRQEPNGRLSLAIGEHRQVFHEPHEKELNREAVQQLRKFLDSAGVTPATVDVVEDEGRAAAAAPAPDMVVTLDHHEARLYTIEGTAENARTLRPCDPHHFLHHLSHRQERELRGQLEREEPSYYAQIAAALARARRIVLVGHGTGHSNAAAHLDELLRAKHPEVSRHIVATKAVDLSSTTEPQLLALALETLDPTRGPGARTR